MIYIYVCTGARPIIRKQEETDAFGEFLTDINDNTSGVNDINAPFFSLFITGRAPIYELVRRI